jgi:hypothetical protein
MGVREEDIPPIGEADREVRLLIASRIAHWSRPSQQGTDRHHRPERKRARPDMQSTSADLGRA